MIRYFGDYLIASIQNRTLKVALPSKLNDPFDFSLAAAGTMTIDDALRILRRRFEDPTFYQTLRESVSLRSLSNGEIKQIILQNPLNVAQGLVDEQGASRDHFKNHAQVIGDANCRLLCFSSQNIEPEADVLMWSHYAFEHRGFRSHFDTSFLHVDGIERKEVEYKKERVSISLRLDTSDPSFHEGVMKSMHTKSEAWSYEHEIRYFISPRLCGLGDEPEMEFMSYPPKALKRIDLGIRSNEEIVKSINESLEHKDYRHVEVYQSEIDDSLFRINYKRIR